MTKMVDQQTKKLKTTKNKNIKKKNKKDILLNHWNFQFRKGKQKDNF